MKPKPRLKFGALALIFPAAALAFALRNYKPASTGIHTIRYVAIGDSYTLGTGADMKHAWPTLLSQHLQASGVPLEFVANTARNGWTTQGAINTELGVFQKSSPTFATLLIGANDTYRGLPPEEFRSQFVYLLDGMRRTLGVKGSMIILNIPDYMVTPTGKHYAAEHNGGANLLAYNRIIEQVAAERSIPVVDLFNLSKPMGKDASLIGQDRLHPSAKEYAIWESSIYPLAMRMLASSDRN